MDKTVLGIFVGAVAVVGSLIWFGQPDANTNSKSISTIASNISNLIKTEETSFDFGSVSMAKGKISHLFRFKNTGLEPVVINKIYTSCMCTEALLVTKMGKFGPFGMPGHGIVSSIKAMVEPGQEAEIEVIFDPAAHGPAGVGKIQRVVTLENSAGSPVEFQFSALVTP